MNVRNAKIASFKKKTSEKGTPYIEVSMEHKGKKKSYIIPSHVQTKYNIVRHFEIEYYQKGDIVDFTYNHNVDSKDTIWKMKLRKKFNEQGETPDSITPGTGG